jgi:hypothetical protein
MGAAPVVAGRRASNPDNVAAVLHPPRLGREDSSL